MFDSIVNNPISLTQVALGLILTVILTASIATLYRRTHTGLSYSQSFAFSIVILGTLISMVMMVIGGSLAIAFGALGAFSLVRFRTAVKDPKDTVFVFFSVVVGMATGTGNYGVAILGTVIIGLIILILSLPI